MNIKRSITIALFTLIIATSVLPSRRLESKSLAVDHVTVIDTKTGAAAPDMTVVITGDKIVTVIKSGQVKLPADAEVIDGKGKYLIPGLWDMHVHIHDQDFFQLLVSNGVTGVREMGGNPGQINGWRRSINDGRFLGPRIVMAGMILDGPQPFWPQISIAVSNESDGRKAVINSKKNGSDFIKVYNGLSREAYYGIMDEAKKQGLMVVGHVPRSIGAAEASDAGQKSIEHLNGVLVASSSPAEMGRQGRDGRMAPMVYNPGKAHALFTKFAKNGTWQAPTLVVKRSTAYLNEFRSMKDPRLKYMPSRITERWNPANDFRFQNRPPEYFAQQKQQYEEDLQIVREMRKVGIRFLAGTDLGNPYIFPGFSLHDELGLLVKAGLTPLEALQAATINPAEFLGLTDTLGTVEQGKTADLVLLEANPLVDIGNAQRINAVFVRGRLVNQAMLSKILGK